MMDRRVCGRDRTSGVFNLQDGGYNEGESHQLQYVFSMDQINHHPWLNLTYSIAAKSGFGAPLSVVHEVIV